MADYCTKKDRKEDKARDRKNGKGGKGGKNGTTERQGFVVIVCHSGSTDVTHQTPEQKKGYDRDRCAYNGVNASLNVHTQRGTTMSSKTCDGFYK